MNPPTFRYHPDPIDTGNIIKSNIECCCCGKARGYIYTGPVYAIKEYNRRICPWCIADGSAHKKLAASFTDKISIGGGGIWDKVPEEVIDEVAHRTPGFSGWQQEQWWTHCQDAGQFLGRVSHKELEEYGFDAIKAIQISTGLDDGAEWDCFYSSLDKDGSPTAYIFRCTKCGKLGGYQDCD